MTANKANEEEKAGGDREEAIKKISLFFFLVRRMRDFSWRYLRLAAQFLYFFLIRSRIPSALLKQNSTTRRLISVVPKSTAKQTLLARIPLALDVRVKLG